jgi:MoaA/NifB/PqqE/SkfB family radical SAM enzyme
MYKNIICTAPSTSILIDTNKGLRQCCYYQSGFLGNLNKNTIIEIINTDKWKELKEQSSNNVWPQGCLKCKNNEEIFGDSLRKNYFEHASEDDVKHNRLKVLEFNGSNICNLSCVHCHSTYSSRWVIERKKLEKVVATYTEEKKEIAKEFRPLTNLYDEDGVSLNAMHLPNPKLVIENIKDLDFSHLKLLCFRGGEPLLNSETTAVLEYLDSINVLQNLNIHITTNATYINDQLVNLFNKGKSVTVNLSIDGIGELFNYIRYGDAKFESVEPVIAALNTVKNLSMVVSVAAMNYSAFNLIDIRTWSMKLAEKYDKLVPIPYYNNCVVSPDYLSMTTLSDETRKKLVEFYTLNSINDEFVNVIKFLSNDFIGNEIHTQWVEYTELLETVRKNDIISIVPELKNELQRK